MKRWHTAAGILLLALVLTTSCRQLYTTSLGKAVARDSITIPSSYSLNQLIDLSQGQYAGDASAAKAILDRISDQKPADLLALSVDDKAAVLNLAASAAVDMQTITNLAKQAAAGGDTNTLITQAFAAFDPSVNLAGVETLLADPTTRSSASVNSIIFASAVVLADVASELGTGGQNTIMSVMASGNVSSLPTAQQTRVTNILAVVTALSSRPDAQTANIDNFNLIDLLKGTQ